SAFIAFSAVMALKCRGTSACARASLPETMSAFIAVPTRKASAYTSLSACGGGAARAVDAAASTAAARTWKALRLFMGSPSKGDAQASVRRRDITTLGRGRPQRVRRVAAPGSHGARTRTAFAPRGAPTGVGGPGGCARTYLGS